MTAPPRSPAFKWYVCGMLLLATMLNYMDRQTLAQAKTRMEQDPAIRLSESQYGTLELGFGVAFGLGAVAAGLLVDRLGVRWMYPAVVCGWSAAGVATAYAGTIGAWLEQCGLTFGQPAGFAGLLLCRVVLGLFESGQWPCALAASQRLLRREDRTLGNSILQSGASIGAVLTPLIVHAMDTGRPGAWRGPFQLIGLAGLAWVLPWLLTIRREDLALPSSHPGDEAAAPSPLLDPASRATLVRRYLVLCGVVVLINMFWHFYRAWMPSCLEKFYGYSTAFKQYFTSVWFITTDVGCLAFGFLSRGLALRWGVHRGRLATFLGAGLCTAMSIAAAGTPRGPLLLALLLCVAFGSLGLFATYYSLTQELSLRHQGKVTGSLSCITWLCTSWMHQVIGWQIEASQANYPRIMFLAGLAPLAAFGILAALWNWPSGSRQQRGEAAVTPSP